MEKEEYPAFSLFIPSVEIDINDCYQRSEGCADFELANVVKL